MRRQLIEALSFPGLLVKQLIEGGNYPHKNLYEATGERCHHCDGSGNCNWDHCLEDFTHRDQKSLEELGLITPELRELLISIAAESGCGHK